MSNADSRSEWKNARDLTAEIDRETNNQREVGAGYEVDTRGAARGTIEVSAQEPGVDRLGRRVIVGREMIVAANDGEGARREEGDTVRGERIGSERGLTRNEGELAQGVKRSANAENLLAQDMERLTDAENFVGEESRLQSQERLADDIEDAKNEAGEGLGFENRIVAKNQEAVAKEIAPEVEKIVAQKSFRPRDLERVYRQGVNATLGIFGRRIGDRN